MCVVTVPDVEQQGYEADTDYRDEWLLEPLSSYQVTFYSVNADGHEHASCLFNAKNTLHGADLNNVNHKTGAFSASECLTDLKNCDIFTSRSHAHCVIENGTGVSTGIILNDETGNAAVGLYSDPFDTMTSGSISISSTDSFANLDIALFIGCGTGYGGGTGNNLPNIVVSQGAEVAIGFSGNINCSEANQWTRNFFDLLSKGYTVESAAHTALNGYDTDSDGLGTAVAADSGLHEGLVVFGNGDHRLSD